MWRYGLNTARALHSYHTRQLTLRHYPMIQGVEVTNDCNLHCGFCKRDRVKRRGVGYMTDDTYSRIVNEKNRHSLRHLRLMMHGEPLMHPDIVKFVRDASHFSKTLGFTTNGLLLSSAKAKDLLDAGLNNICFSIHTPKVVDYALRFLKLKNEIKPSCYISIAVVDPYETKYLDRFLWSGVDNVVIQPEHDWGLSGQRKHVCLWPWWGLTVYWNGDVAPCCLYEDLHTMGNLHDQSLMDIWNGDKYRKLRREMLNGSACSTCAISEITFNDPYLRVTQPSRRAFPRALLQLVSAIL